MFLFTNTLLVILAIHPMNTIVIITIHPMNTIVIITIHPMNTIVISVGIVGFICRFSKFQKGIIFFLFRVFISLFQKSSVSHCYFSHLSGEMVSVLA